MAINTSYSTPANGTEAIYRLITLLTANGWRIPQWSDATTLTTPAAPLASNPYGAAPGGWGSGVGNLGNTSAWFRITSPTVGGYTREWLFQRGSADQTWTVARGRTGFTGGAPNATTLPTDATGVTLINALSLFDTTLTSRLLISVDTVNGAWSMFTVVTGGGNTRTFVCDEALSAGTYPAADADPYIFGLYYNPTGLTPASFATSVPITFYKRTRHGLASPSNASVTLNPIFLYGTSSYAPASGASIQLAPEPYNTTEVPLQIPVFRPGSTGTSTGWCGYSNGMRWCTVWGRSNGQTLTDTINYWIFAGGMWIPWDSSTPTI